MVIIHVRFLACRFGDGDLIDLGFWWGWRPKRWIMWTWVARYAAYMYCKGQGKHLEWIVVWERSQKITIPLKFNQLRRGCFCYRIFDRWSVYRYLPTTKTDQAATWWCTRFEKFKNRRRIPNFVLELPFFSILIDKLPTCCLVKSLFTLRIPICSKLVEGHIQEASISWKAIPRFS